MGKESIKVRKVGQYILQKKIGQGSMGTIWLSHHMGLDIPVAVKLLKTPLMEEDPDYIERFIKEGNLAGSIHHKNIIRIYDAGYQGQTYYMVMEFVDGGNVQELIDLRGQLTPDEVLEFGIKICDALIEAHAHNVIHRDIKPENIMLTKEGRLKLADLGLAKRLDDDYGGSTMLGAALGTPNYMSPEQTRNALAADERSDIYSLGATLYHMLTGRVPFEGTSCVDIMMKHCNDDLIPPSEYVEELPRGINNIICKMMNKLPEDRFQSCQDLHDELNKLKYKEEGSKRLVTRTQINLKGIDLGELKARRKKTDDEKPKKTLFSKNKIMAALGACVFFVVLIFLIKSQSKDNAVSKHKKPPEIKASTLTKVVVPEILDTPLEIIPAGLSTEVLIPYDVSSVGRDLLAEGVFKVGRSVPPMVKLNTSSLIIKSTDKSARGLALTGRSFKNYKLIIQYTVNQPLSHLELQLHRQVANRERQLKLVLSSKSEWNMSGSFILKNAEVEDYSGDQLKLVMTKIPEIKHLRTKQKTQNTLGALNTMEVTCYEKSICIVQNGLTIIKIRDLPVTEGGFMISSSGVSDILVSKIELFPLVLKSK